MLINLPDQCEKEAERDALRERLEGTNISDQSFLATDYLNHFNEVVMTLDMAKSVPSAISDLADWQPIDYETHFRQSSFPHGDLAITAYRLAPEQSRRLFDRHTNTLAALIIETLEHLPQEESDFPIEWEDETRRFLSDNVARMQVLIGKLNAVVHGSDASPDIDGSHHDRIAPHISQNEIDALFD